VVVLSVPEEVVGLVAWMVVTDPEAVTEVAELQSFVGAVEAKAVSAAAAVAAQIAHTLLASPTAGT
jgi:hypothetical protein